MFRIIINVSLKEGKMNLWVLETKRDFRLREKVRWLSYWLMVVVDRYGGVSIWDFSIDVRVGQRVKVRFLQELDFQRTVESKRLEDFFFGDVVRIFVILGFGWEKKEIRILNLCNMQAWNRNFKLRI